MKHVCVAARIGEDKAPGEDNSRSIVKTSNAAFVIKPMERLAQLVVVPIVQVELNVVDDFESSPRGAGGFGSTGQH